MLTTCAGWKVGFSGLLFTKEKYNFYTHEAEAPPFQYTERTKAQSTPFFPPKYFLRRLFYSCHNFMLVFRIKNKLPCIFYLHLPVSHSYAVGKKGKALFEFFTFLSNWSTNRKLFEMRIVLNGKKHFDVMLKSYRGILWNHSNFFLSFGVPNEKV